jgi:hypothetical protein
MSLWSPTQKAIITWKPSNGWNRAFSEKEKLECTRLYVFLIQKRYTEKKAEQLALMCIYKEKYKGLLYSDLQEKEIQEALRPIIHSEEA